MSDSPIRPLAWLRRVLFGRSLNLADHSVFHNLSLIAFFAWVGLGADGLSSSCYGPAEAYLALGQHGFLAVFVALASAATIIIISAAYSQIIELFPSGGGGYLVASKLLSPTVGMVSGCALLIDYVLTIAISIASGADAVFSFLPPEWLPYRLPVAAAGIIALTLLNLRGVKESVLVLVPVFMVFVVTHALGIGYGLWSHAMDLPAVVTRVGADVGAARSELGTVGMLLLVLHAYSMGAGTYTGIEAVSNGLPILREPKEKTGKRTMLYMALSLSLTVVGLILCFILYRVTAVPGKTLNAVLFESMAAGFGPTVGGGFVLITLVSEALLLFVAAQAGFVDGPRVLSNMALDRWFPTRFALLSDRLVTQNGIALMGVAGLILLLATDGAVDILIVLYSINVFVTFVLSQLGMVRHWWQVRGSSAHWGKGMLLNGLGLALTSFILITVTIVKFDAGGWVTIVITGALVLAALAVKRHYNRVWKSIRKLDVLRAVIDPENPYTRPIPKSAHGPKPDPQAPTAVIFVNGFSGLGVHTLLSVVRLFGKDIANYVFVQIGVVDAAVFRGTDKLNQLKTEMEEGLGKYVSVMTERGYHAEAHWAVGTDIVQEVLELAPPLRDRFPKAIFFGGQIVFEHDTFFTRFLHNYVVFSLQRQIYRLGMPFMIMPVRLDLPDGEDIAAV
ncbi:APC family permease [Desulfovibrio sp. TomC]|uniref:APC family permease n=1 Tax=Desulfovibrio sp. TomC TaxID=1562888 RepID=UPI000573E19D|nr:APC family permease [Desulfovibrio sp. TomC]KHK00546.1 amino acid transporter-like protein [Desulfovibrio sp. TomC]